MRGRNILLCKNTANLFHLLFFMILRNETIDRQMEKRPQEEVQEQEVCNIHTLGQQQVQRYEEDRYAQNRHHHHPYTHTRTKQLVMEMILIGQERVTMITKTMIMT